MSILAFFYSIPPPLPPPQLGLKMYTELAAGSPAPRAAPQSTSEEDAATLLAVAAAANENRNYLRSQANANNGAPQLVGVSVKRTSDKKLRKTIKAANKAAKNASAAASSLTEAHSDFLEDVGFDPEYLEQERMLGLQGGGFRGASDADIGERGPKGLRLLFERRGLLVSRRHRSPLRLSLLPSLPLYPPLCR